MDVTTLTILAGLLLSVTLALGLAVLLRRDGSSARSDDGQSLSIETVVIIGIAVVLAVAVGTWAVGRLTSAQQQVPDPAPPAVVGG